MSQDFENQFITSVCDGKFDIHKKINRTKLPLSYFALYQDEWGFMERYFDDFGTYPSRATLTEEFPNFDPEEPDNKIDYYLKKLTDRHNYSMLNQSIAEVTKIMQKPGYDSVDDAIRILQGASDKFDHKVEVNDIDMTSDFGAGLRDYEAGEDEEGEIFPVPYQGLIDNGITPHFMSGELIIMFARMGFGKTWSMCWWAIHDWWHGNDTLIFTPEMTVRQLRGRIDALLFGLDYTKTTFKTLSPEELDEYKEAVERMREAITARLIICPLTDFNSSREKAWDYMRRKIDEHGCPCVHADSAHLLFGVNGLDFVQEAYTLSRQSKQITKNHGIKFNLYIQAGREAEGKKDGGGLKAIQWGDAFAQDGDFVVELCGKRGAPIRVWDFLKTRRGQEGKITTNYRFNPMDLTEIDGVTGIDEEDFDPDDFEDEDG